MNAHLHERPADVARGPRPHASPGVVSPRPRPRWLLPGVAIAAVLGALVLAGVIPFSVVVYGGLFVGMMAMHMGGHGHGAHGGHGSGSDHRDHGGDLSPVSPGTQRSTAGSNAWPGSRVEDASDTDGIEGDQHRSHTCH
jgi:hypothetical protein